LSDPRRSRPGQRSTRRLDDQSALELSLTFLETEAFNFGKRFIQDSKVRQNYLNVVKRFSNEALDAVARGEISAYEAMTHTHAMRNEILELSRLKSSDLGRAQAEALKATGVTLESLMEKYAQKIYGKAFAQLSEAERGTVYLAIVESSGRANPRVSLRARRLGMVGKAFWVFTAAVAIYNIATAENKVQATVREGVTIGGGMAGGAAGGAAAGLLCGPGAPVCVAIGVFVGGALGAFGADKLFDGVLDSGREMLDGIRNIRPAWGFPGKMPFCFAPGTPVLGPAGRRPIEAIRPGDSVLRYDYETGCVGRTEVVAVDVHEGEFDLLGLHVDGHEPLYVTAGHWFYTGESWVLSEELSRHGRVLTASGTSVKVTLTGPARSQPIRVYNVRTEFGTYLVGNSGLVASGVVLPNRDADNVAPRAALAVARS
jgi:hypothetical protein